MRWLVIATLIALTTRAHADDGYYFAESVGPTSYRGELSRFQSGPRLQIGFDIRRGPWSLEGFVAAVMPDASPYTCEGQICHSTGLRAALTTYGLDVRERWRLLYLRNAHGRTRRAGLFVGLHGGPRWIEGEHALTGYYGSGFGGGTSLEADALVIGAYVDLGIDVMHLEGPNGTLRGSTPYISFGIKWGWL